MAKALTTHGRGIVKGGYQTALNGASMQSGGVEYLCYQIEHRRTNNLKTLATELLVGAVLQKYIDPTSNVHVDEVEANAIALKAFEDMLETLKSEGEF